jgi:hypothetical protein
MYQLNHISKNGNIQETKHNSIREIVQTLNAKEIENNTVFLLSFYDEINEKHLIFVSEHFDFILDVLRNTHLSFDTSFSISINLHEYKSYESAYKVALLLSEEHSSLTYSI